MSTHLVESRSVPPSTSHPKPAVEQCTSLTGPTNDKCMLHHSSIIGHGSSDKDLLRSLSQALLECLDRHDHHDRLNSAIKRITRICLAEILVKCQPEVALLDEDPWKYGNIDFQAISVVKSHTPVALNGAIHLPSTDIPLMSQPSQEYSFLLQGSVGINDTLPEGTDPPLGQQFAGRVSRTRNLSFAYHSQLDFFHFGTSGPAAQSFHSSAPQHRYSEAQTLSCPSTNRQPHLPVAQSIQEKVECIWQGCSRVVRKDSYTRHVNETHLRKVKAVCARCERAFPRMYLKKNHELTCRG
ncbi:hypothetical protein M405DRAFT_450192 [Rhizopogon salebrosus TDB-379]|nr:hypothetical protein M405DRAFT_450192 [Rhizopogon salebrosus TDB-379]